MEIETILTVDNIIIIEIEAVITSIVLEMEIIIGNIGKEIIEAIPNPIKTDIMTIIEIITKKIETTD